MVDPVLLFVEMVSRPELRNVIQSMDVTLRPVLRSQDSSASLTITSVDTSAETESRTKTRSAMVVTCLTTTSHPHTAPLNVRSPHNGNASTPQRSLALRNAQRLLLYQS